MAHEADEVDDQLVDDDFAAGFDEEPDDDAGELTDARTERAARGLRRPVGPLPGQRETVHRPLPVPMSQPAPRRDDRQQHNRHRHRSRK